MYIVNIDEVRKTGCRAPSSHFNTATGYCELMLDVRFPPDFVPICVTLICSFKHIILHSMLREVAIPLLLQTLFVYRIATTLAHGIHSILWESVTVSIFNEFKSLIPRTQLPISWKTIVVILRPRATNVTCQSINWSMVTVTLSYLLQMKTVRWGYILKPLYQVVICPLLAGGTISVTYSFLAQTLEDVVG